ncbi:MAG: hypothetical protein EB027_01585 [Actinobacteria bacterium]|nr:hypothetical protein [Actinomycetota bacterium]
MMNAMAKKDQSDAMRGARRSRRRRRLVVIASALAVAAGAVVWDAARVPGADPLIVKLGVWGRAHGLGFAITAYEQVRYKLNPPKVGGTATISPTTSASANPGRKLKPIAPVASGEPIPHEGVWQPVVVRSGRPVVHVAYLRPDSQHTSYLTAVMLFDHRYTRLQLHPGYEDPGEVTAFGVPDRITRDMYTSVVAAFPGGFKVSDARGGFYLNGHTAGRLQTGSASLVTYQDGRVDIGAWGSQVTMNSDVTSVRQNLKLLVDQGRVTPSAEAAVKSNWGATLDGVHYVWRTGAGVRRNGDLVFAVGDSLSARTLAHVLHAAGAVRAMQLDINPDWAAGYWFSRPKPGSTSQRPVAHKVLDFKKPLYRWFTATSRDFYSVHYVGTQDYGSTPSPSARATASVK